MYSYRADAEARARAHMTPLAMRMLAMRGSCSRGRLAPPLPLPCTLQGDPFSVAGSLWSFNFFLYNRKLKRILFFTAAAIGKHTGGGLGADKDFLGDDDDDERGGGSGFFHMEDDSMDL